MDQPLKVNVRNNTPLTSSMVFPADVQQQFANLQQEREAEDLSPREKYNQHQEKLRTSVERTPLMETKTATPVQDHLSRFSLKPRTATAVSLHTGITDSQRDAGMCSLWLPSNSYFYDFHTLSVSTRVKGLHQAKFNKAYKENNIRYTVEAISSLLGDGVSAMDLTLEDFFFVMYWIRLVAYTKSQYIHRVSCKSDKHLAMIKSGVVDETTLVSSHFVSATNLTETYFDPTLLNSMTFENLTKEGITLRPPVMRDVVEFSEEITQRFSKTDPATGEVTFSPEYEEMAYLGDLASFIATYNGDSSLSLGQRMTVAGEMSVEAVDEVRQFANATSGYGVSESITVVCPTCGEQIESEVSISAQSFL